MKALLIISNRGNHSGANVKWTLAASCNSLKDAKAELIESSLGLSDDHIYKNGRSFDETRNKYICTNKDTSYSYDGFRFMVITKKDLALFNGGSYGYLPDSILAHFKP